MKSYQKAALAIAVIVALADSVIVYDLWLAGSWWSTPLLSGAKTAAFVLLFVGSLIAEMQHVSRSVRWLLLASVVLLGSYQAMVNVVVNYHAAVIPATAAEFFQGWLTPAQVKWWSAVADGVVRSTIVVLMWLVTGLVWRGAATGDEAPALPSEIEFMRELSRSQIGAMINRAGMASQPVAAEIVGVSKQAVSQAELPKLSMNGKGVEFK
jgi:hypothetical protein